MIANPKKSADYRVTMFTLSVQIPKNVKENDLAGAPVPCTSEE